MIRVDDAFMKEVGLGDMPEPEKRAFMEHAQEELEVRVGKSIGAQLTDAQMSEFEAIEDLALAAQWLERNVPGFRQIVENVFFSFKNELAEEKQKILQ